VSFTIEHICVPFSNDCPGCQEQLHTARLRGALLALSRVMLWAWMEEAAQTDRIRFFKGRECGEAESRAMVVTEFILHGRLRLTYGGEE